MIDLHCHSTYSDGTKSPAELLAYAERLGVEVLALTDHDTVSGIDDFFSVESNIEKLAGTEISIELEKGTFHLVGLMLDHKERVLVETLDKLKQYRRERNVDILKSASELLGYEVQVSDVTYENVGEISRPHIARFLVSKGVVKDIPEAFEKYLAKGAPLYHPKKRLYFEEAAEMIKGAGGLSILAHPKTLKLERDEYLPFIKDLKDKGLDALEVYSSDHDKDDFAFFNDIASKLDLGISGGSDYHGENKAGVQLGTGKGEFRLEREIYENLLKLKEGK